eukprot:m.37909 g.37909  ORF g.37909 m.37909 type:complete len:927 (+) comp32477_c0_seq6:89-2869(+)
MTEFRINHVVCRLLSLLGSSSDGAGPEVYVDILTKHLTPYVTTQVSTHNAKRRIAEYSTEHEHFLMKYDELKSKQSRELDALVYLLSKIAQNENVLDMLKFASGSGTSEKDDEVGEGNFLGEIAKDAVNLIPKGTMTQKELDILRDQLADLTTSLDEAEKRKSDVAQKRRTRNALESKGIYQIPDEPEWLLHRPYLSADFVLSSEPSVHEQAVVPVGSLPLQVQEFLLIDDLLYVMTGIEGKYILVQPVKRKFSTRKFVTDQSLDSSLSVLVKRMLPLCTQHSFLCRFIEEYSQFEHGVVAHALCSAMQSVLKEYYILVAQLEHQNRLEELSLQKMWFHLQPTIKIFDILHNISLRVVKGECRGGHLLSLLHTLTTGYVGDPSAQEFCLFLTQKACVPYFELLEQWIYQGVIRDPYAEFLVSEHRDVRKDRLKNRYNDAYWDRRYTICRDRIPIFLQKVTDMVLRTGKYLNVTRECGRDVHCPGAKEIVYTLKERIYVDQIEEAYGFASAQLLDLLLREKDLLGRLRSVKHYFLLDQGDFFVQFLDLAEVELRKEIPEISCSKLEALLELALRTSVVGTDPYIDDLKIQLFHCDLVTQLTQIMTVLENQGTEYSFHGSDGSGFFLAGFQSLCFDYTVQWPVSLIINRKALVKYQFLFRFLFLAKHVERELNSVWFSAKTLRHGRQSTYEWQSTALTLRQRMLNFVQNFEYFVMVEVIEPNWQILECALQKVKTVDDVLDAHSDFLDHCLRDTMLTNSELLKIVHKLLVVCLTFSSFMKRLTVHEENSSYEADDDDDFASQLQDVPQSLADFERNFTKHVLGLLRKLQLTPEDGAHQMANLASRLDFNGFYNSKMDRQALVTVLRKSSGPAVPLSFSSSALVRSSQSHLHGFPPVEEVTDSGQPSAFKRIPVKGRELPEVPKPSRPQ